MILRMSRGGEFFVVDFRRDVRALSGILESYLFVSAGIVMLD